MSKILITDPKFKQKSRFRIWLKRIIIILFLVLIAGIIYILFFSPIFRIQKIILFEDGKDAQYPELLNQFNDILNSQRIFIFPASNFFLFDINSAKNQLLGEFFQLDSIEIKKELPNKIIINFIKRKPQIIFCNTNCFLADKNGFVFNQISKIEGYLFLVIRTDLNVKVGEKVIEPQILDFLIKIKENIAQKISDLTIEEFNLTKSNLKLKDVIAKTDESWNIYFDLSLDPIEQLDNLEKVLELDIKDRRKNLEYVDLRFGNKIFYKYK